MRRRRSDVRFEIVDPAARPRARPKRAFAVDGPALVPLRVIASAAHLARRSEVEDASAVDVALADGTRLRFPSEVTASFLVEVLTALRSAPC